MKNILKRISEYNSKFIKLNKYGFTLNMWILYRLNYAMEFIDIFIPLWLFGGSTLKAVTASVSYIISSVVLFCFIMLRNTSSPLDALKVINEKSESELSRDIFNEYNFQIILLNSVFLVTDIMIYRFGLI